ncbi:MAG TPA: hypothetical protein VG815_16355 [Chloroflexota bacterium]|nr:hypothetical protein [Chloroflexota bacterium]
MTCTHTVASLFTAQRGPRSGVIRTFGRAIPAACAVAAVVAIGAGGLEPSLAAPTTVRGTTASASGAGTQAAATSASHKSFKVTTTADAGTGSLRAAILASNAAAPGPNKITFHITGSGTQTISPLTPLAAITVPVTIDGSTEPGFKGIPLIRLDGASAGSGAPGLTITAGSSTVRDLEVTQWSGSGIALMVKGSNVIAGDYIGDDGNVALGNGIGITIDSGSSANTIGGRAVATRNIISSNTFKGIDINGLGVTRNVIQGNYIGTNTAGTVGIPSNGFTVDISGGAARNTVGGTRKGAGNLISEPGQIAVNISDKGTTGNVVQGNLIGTDATGTAPIGDFVGVNIRGGASNNIIGGTMPGARNVISGSTFEGIEIHDYGTNGNLVQGNYIGTNAAGSAVLGNGRGYCGISLSLGPTGTVIGGQVPGARNVISGNACGVLMTDGYTLKNTVAGNYVGTDSTGKKPLPNGTGVVIRLRASLNTIGGTSAGARNVIAASTLIRGTGDGVLIQGPLANGNLIQNNAIGATGTGSTRLDNQVDGVVITSGAQNNIVGGNSSHAGNAISGNGANGVDINGANTKGNIVQGNVIGSTQTRTAMPPNTFGRQVVSRESTKRGPTSSMVHLCPVHAMTFTRPSAEYHRGLVLKSERIWIRRVIMAVRDAVSPRSVLSAGGCMPGRPRGDSRRLAARMKTELSNGGSGVLIFAGATGNTVGGTQSGQSNTIAHNAIGVKVTGAITRGNRIAENSIYLNGKTVKGPGIAITTGANDNLKPPTLASVAKKKVSGKVASGGYRIEVFSNSSCADPEGAKFLASVTTSSTTWSVTLPPSLNGGQGVTATATANKTGSTSAFSQCKSV